jgi:ABC-type multidrug transport system ATPase subunit
VDDVTLTVPRGQVIGLLGPNGAGKTTTIKMACGLIAPAAGTIRLSGYDVSRRRADAVTRCRSRRVHRAPCIRRLRRRAQRQQPC